MAVCLFIPKSLISEYINTAARGVCEIFGPACCICHPCAINESRARHTANVVAVKYPAYCTVRLNSVWEVKPPTSHTKGSFDKIHDLGGRNQVNVEI